MYLLCTPLEAEEQSPIFVAGVFNFLLVLYKNNSLKTFGALKGKNEFLTSDFQPPISQSFNASQLYIGC